MGISVNGPSGIDTASLISQLTELEMQKVYTINSQQRKIKDKISAYSQLETYLNDVKKAGDSVDSTEDFNLFTTGSSDDEAVTVTTRYGADEGNFDLKVFQLASREKLISSDNLITDRSKTFADLSIPVGNFSINGVEISITATDTIDNLREKINNATKEDGSSLGVSATVLKTADDNYRFVLTSTESGTDSAEYVDLNGGVLQSLGIINSPGSKEEFTSVVDIKTVIGIPAAGETINIKGTDDDGNTVDATYTHADGNVEQDFLDWVEASFGEDVTASFGGGGELIIEDLAGGVTSLDVSDITVGSTQTFFTNDVQGASNKGITHEKQSSSATIESDFTDFAVGEKITITGKDGNGEVVESIFVKKASSTSSDFLKFVEGSFNGAVTASFNGGKLEVEDKNGGESLFEVTNINFSAPTTSTTTDYVFSRDTLGTTEDNILSMGKDAFFSVDNINISSDSNDATGFITGVDFKLKKVSYDSPTNLTIDRDYGAVAKKVDDLLNSYNAISRYVADVTKYGNTEEGETVGKLAGDMTIKNMASSVRQLFYENLDISGLQTFSSLSQLGVETNTSTGQLELDKEIFTDALKTNFDEIISLFVQRGKSTNSNVLFGSNTKETDEGVYELTESAGTYTLTNDGGATNYTGNRVGDIVRFNDGPAKDLFITAPIGSGDTTLTFARGLSGRLDQLIDRMTDSETGMVTTKQQSLNSEISRLGDRADFYQRSVDSYHDRLVKQFSSMEQRISSMQSQQNAMAGMMSGWN
jgi:flagellar hook-associated protein 2